MVHDKSRPLSDAGGRKCPYFPTEGGDPANPFIELGMLKPLAALVQGERLEVESAHPSTEPRSRS